MAKQLDNSFFVFSKPASALPQMLIAGGLGFLMVTGLILSVLAGNWPLTAIFALAFIGISVLAFYAWDLTRKVTAYKRQQSVAWETALPEIQRQNLNIQVTELAHILDVEPEQITDLQSAYIVAEDLALRQIQQEENVPILRNVSIAGVPFDTVLVRGSDLICGEVVFLVAPELKQEKIDSILHKAAAVSEGVEKMKLGLSVRLMLVLITQLTPEDERYLRTTLGTDRFKGTPVDIDIRFLDFEVLQRIFVTE
ncbi:MAG: hypothetical protein QUS14_02400 [Pyrinomonadaceae bacterium]|nr:hypothetical protein [Pyrinomonadaceae bacterium]